MAEPAGQTGGAICGRGIDILHVPHNGNAAATIAVVGGHVDALFTSPIGAHKLVEAGKLRALVVTSEQRVPVYPDVPTFGQAGLPGLRSPLCNISRKRRGIPFRADIDGIS